MRCPDCNKFVSYDEPELDVCNENYNGTEVDVDVTVTLCCAECGTILREGDIDCSFDIETEIQESLSDGEEDVEIDDIDNVEAEYEEIEVTESSKGRKLKNSKYQPAIKITALVNLTNGNSIEVSSVTEFSYEQLDEQV